MNEITEVLKILDGEADKPEPSIHITKDASLSMFVEAKKTGIEIRIGSGTTYISMQTIKENMLDAEKLWCYLSNFMQEADNE